MKRYTSEPWFNAGTDISSQTEITVAKCATTKTYRGPRTMDETHANAQRICDCVNALMNVYDPMQFMRDFNSLLDAIHGPMYAIAPILENLKANMKVKSK